jgi:CarD family transcriptional regulator, regulator of rRNA transcription
VEPGVSGTGMPHLAQIWLIQAVSATLALVAGAQERAGFIDGRAHFSHGRSGLYDIGDKVVYPHHGAGTVVKKEKREVLGQQREYLTIKILHNDMTVQVPSENAEKVGLRRVIGEKEVGVVLKALTGVSTEMPKNWNRRFKHNRDKMKTGDILELAEVVRNLALRDREKGLSTGEKQMFVKAKKILASELMYAKDMDEETCADWLEEVLASDGPAPKKKPAAKKKAAAAATA